MTERSTRWSGRLRDLVPAAIADAVLAGAGAAIETGELQTLDASFDLPDGRRAFETRISPSGADEVTAIIRDFTDQRAAQTELRQSRTRSSRRPTRHATAGA